MKILTSELRSRDERLDAGRALRESLPRSSHAAWKSPARRRDPIAVLLAMLLEQAKEIAALQHELEQHKHG